jgi:hypothetical protein
MDRQPFRRRGQALFEPKGEFAECRWDVEGTVVRCGDRSENDPLEFAVGGKAA